MADNNKYDIVEEEELLQKIKEEIEVLESIYSDQDIILKAPDIKKNQQAVADFAEFQAGDSKEFEFQQTDSVIPIQLKIVLKTGGDDTKVGLEFYCYLTINQFYPFNSPEFAFTIKGVDDQMKDEIAIKVQDALKAQVQEKRESEDSEGFLYQFYESLSEILTKYNDTCRGRCAVCLERFSLKDPPDEEEEEEIDEDEKFTERDDLVRIDVCYHRFHVLCLHRDWFMQRQSEKDKFGNTIEFKVPNVKRCPICRRDVEDQEIKHILELFKSHPEIEDHGYDQCD